MFGNKTVAATILALAALSKTANAEDFDCFDEVSCGVQEGFPYYYDPFADTTSLFQSMKFSLINAVLLFTVSYKYYSSP